MAEPTQNSGSNAEGNGDNKDGFHIQLRRVDANKANRRINNFRKRIDKNPDEQVRNIPSATAFYVDDVIKLIEANPGCKKLRIYNGFRRNGTYVMFMAAVGRQKAANAEAMADSPSREADQSSGSGAVVLRSCCPCNPCNIRTLSQ